jgi:hypothetical protein
MRVFVISPGRDTGGQGVRIKQAFDRHAPGWEVRAMHSKDTYIRYPTDLYWDKQEAVRLYEWADVVHHKNRLDAYAWFDGGQRKPTIIHHQGTRLRTNAAAVFREGRSIGAVQLVSTVDLQTCAPSAGWLPSPYPLDEIAAYRRDRANRRVRIVHSPTNRRAKGTPDILKALDQLSRRFSIEVDLVENVPWKVCLSRKGRADIFIDQLTLGYGNNAIEAWAMGVPVVSGVEDPVVRDHMLATWGELPFVEATRDTLVDVLAPLIRSAELREEWGARGRAHVEKYHEEAAVVARLQDIYRSAKRTRGPERLVLAGEQ